MEATQMSINSGMDEEDVVYIYIRILFSHKKEQNSAIYSNMYGLQNIMLSEINQTDKDKYHMISLNVESKKKLTYIAKQKHIQKYRKPNCGYQRGAGIA